MISPGMIGQRPNKPPYDPGTGTGSTGGGGGGGGGSSTPSGGSPATPGTTGTSGLTDYNDADEAARFFGIGGNPEVWKDSTTGQDYLVYMFNDVEPPIPLLFEVSGTTDEEGNQHTLEAFFGEGNPVVYDRTMDTTVMNTTGAVRFGTTNNLDASEGDPWIGFKDRVERASEVSPWMNDDEMLGLIAGAYLEGRSLEQWELEATDWWDVHNVAQRKWLKLSMADPSQAASQISSDKLFVASAFDKIGADGSSPEIIAWMANKLTTGAWNQSMITSQIEAITSGWTEIDPELQGFINKGNYDTPVSEQNNTVVRNLYNEWLGPAFPPSDADIAEWSTKIRNSQDGQDELVNMLRGQRMAMYPEYENPELTYNQIAGPWRNLGQNLWGERMDETSDLFQRMVRANDYGESSSMLRTEGLKQNKVKVWQDATRSMRSDQSTKVRNAL